MTSPLCVATGGWCRRVFHYRPPTPMYRNSPPLCAIVLQIPSLMPLKMRKVQLPPSIAAVVQAVAESSRCSLSTALAGVLGGINLCVAEAYDVKALARLPVPTALYLVVSSESGWRKSEALGCGFSAHDAADNATEAAWKAAKKAADTDADTAKKPADRSPVALRDNSTIPALLRALAWGRRTQGLKMTEASTLFAGHSFSHGRVDSMGELTKLWDGVPSSVLRVRDDNLEFRLSGQRLTMCCVGQPQVVDKVVFSDDAANGFGPSSPTA